MRMLNPRVSRQPGQWDPPTNPQAATEAVPLRDRQAQPPSIPLLPSEDPLTPAQGSSPQPPLNRGTQGIGLGVEEGSLPTPTQQASAFMPSQRKCNVSLHVSPALLPQARSRIMRSKTREPGVGVAGRYHGYLFVSSFTPPPPAQFNKDLRVVSMCSHVSIIDAPVNTAEPLPAASLLQAPGEQGPPSQGSPTGPSPGRVPLGLDPFEGSAGAQLGTSLRGEPLLQVSHHTDGPAPPRFSKKQGNCFSRVVSRTLSLPVQVYPPQAPKCSLIWESGLPVNLVKDFKTKLSCI